jgi:carboxymethylenebutenolidase
MVEFPVEDRSGHGYLALPTANHGPGVIVLHAWWGLTLFFTSVCDRLADEGFVTFAPDLYAGQTAQTIEQAQQLQQQYEGKTTYQTISAAVSYLRTHSATTGDRVGVVGFSMGGSWALMLEDGIGAIVTFYGTTDPTYVTVKASVQGHFAEVDEYATEDEVHQIAQAVERAGQEAIFYTYPGTVHWFFEQDRPDAYHAEAAELAWQRTTAFLRKQLS